MATRERRPRLGIFGHVGNGNLGDEAIVASVIQATRKRFPEAELIGFTLTPDDTRERHGISAHPIRRFANISNEWVKAGGFCNNTKKKDGKGVLEQLKEGIKRFPIAYAVLKKTQAAVEAPGKVLEEARFLIESSRHLAGLDMLIVAGSQQLIDYVEGGPWGHPYTVLKWVAMARIRNVQVAFLSCGVGPINTWLGRLFVSLSLRLANYRSFRDEASISCVQQLGVAGENYFVPDLAFGLSLSAADALRRPEGVPLIVGVNPVPYWDAGAWVGGGPVAYRRYIRTLADFASWLIESGYWVLFFPTQLKLDPPVIKDIRLAMRDQSGTGGAGGVLDVHIDSFEEMTAALAMTDVVIGTRFHAIVLSCVLKKPVLAIAYAVKTNNLMEQMGQSDSVLSIGDLCVAGLRERLEALESRAAIVEAELAKRTEVNRISVSLQYEKVFGLLESVS